MKVKKLASAVFLMLYFGVIIAGDNTAKISKIIRVDNTVEIVITSSEPFYVGSRPYSLHIGDKVFSRSNQLDSDTESTLIFNIPFDEFNKLKDKAEATLVYGFYTASGDANEGEAKQFPGPCWKLGIFNKEMLGH